VNEVSFFLFIVVVYVCVPYIIGIFWSFRPHKITESYHFFYGFFSISNAEQSEAQYSIIPHIVAMCFDAEVLRCDRMRQEGKQ
jgi:hypothetical protein